MLPKLIYFLALFKCNKHADWTIHGQWVDNADGGYPSFCRKVKFDIQILDPIMDQLNKKWPSCRGKSNEAFWNWEFQKHASCFEHNITQFFYFNTTLRLYDSLNKKILNKYCKNKKNCLIPIKHSQIHNVSSEINIIKNINWYESI